MFDKALIKPNEDSITVVTLGLAGGGFIVFAIVGAISGYSHGEIIGTAIVLGSVGLFLGAIGGFMGRISEDGFTGFILGALFGGLFLGLLIWITGGVNILGGAIIGGGVSGLNGLLAGGIQQDYINKNKNYILKLKDKTNKIIEDAKNLIKEKHLDGKNIEEAQKLLDKAIEASRQGNYDQSYGFAENAMLVISPLTDNLLFEAKNLASEAKKEFDLKNYKKAIEIWLSSVDKYQKATDFAKRRNEHKIVSYLREVRTIEKIRENIAKAEIDKDHREMLEYVNIGDKKITKAEKLCGDQNFDDSKNAYEEAIGQFEEALKFAKKRNFTDDLKRIEETIVNIKTSVESILLNKGNKLLKLAGESYEDKRFEEAEKIYSKTLDYLVVLKIQRKEYEELLIKAKEGKIRAKLEFCREIIQNGDDFLNKKKYVQAKKEYVVADNNLRNTVKEANGLNQSKLIEEFNVLIQENNHKIEIVTKLLLEVDIIEPEMKKSIENQESIDIFRERDGKKRSNLPVTRSMSDSHLIIKRTVYDPVTKNLISEKNLDYPVLIKWFEIHSPPDYWYILRIDNTGSLIEEWTVEFETPLALSVKEAYIEGIERKFELRREHENYNLKHILTVPKEYGIPLPTNGVRRLFFRLNIDCSIALLSKYSISGKITANDDFKILKKDFPFSCELKKLKETWINMPDEVDKYLDNRAKEYKLIKDSSDEKSLRRSVYYCCELFEIYLNIGKPSDALKICLDLEKYAKGNTREKVKKVVQELEIIVERSINKDEDFLEKAKVVTHQVRMDWDNENDFV